jgi:hypothetical protein
MQSDRSAPRDRWRLRARSAITKEHHPRPLWGLPTSMRVAERELAFIDETLLPEQFLTPTYESRRVWTGERRLLLGVLEEAVCVFFQYRSVRTSRGKQLFREAQEWLWSNDRHWLYSFENICDHLHLDPDYLRRGLQRWEQTAERSESSTVTRPNGTPPTMKSSFRKGSSPGFGNASRFPLVSAPTKAEEAKG